MVDLFPKVIFTGLLLVALVIDVRSLRLPNRVVFLIIGAFIICAPLRQLSLEDTLVHLATGAGLFGALFAVALFGALTSSLPLGGGDVKFAGAIGLWLGFGHPFFVFVAWLLIFLVALIAFIVALAMSRQFPFAMPLTGIVWVDDVTLGAVSIRKARVPFGVPLALAAIAATWLS